MNFSKPVGLSCVLLGLSFSSVAFAQTAATSPAVAGDGGHATGFMLQGRLQTQASLLSLAGPGFLIGYQGKPFALGLQLGLTRVGISETPTGRPENSASVLMYQIVPTAMYDFWHSADGRARGNVIGGVGYGRASVSVTSSSQDCVADGNGGQTCTDSSEEQKVGAGFIPVMLGIGGDYFLGKNFALGLEGGFQGLFVTGLDNQSNGTTTDIAASANMQFAYGAVRATLVLGD
jgi:hypothetical protein